MTTEQLLIAAIGALWGVTSGAFLYIRAILEKRDRDKDAIIAELKATIERDRAEVIKIRERQLSSLEESVSTQKQNFEVLKAMYEKLTEPQAQPRRRAGGD